MLLSRTTTSLWSLLLLYFKALLSLPLTHCFLLHTFSLGLHTKPELPNPLSLFPSLSFPLSLSCSASPRTRAWIVYLLSTFSYFSPVSLLQVKTLTCFLTLFIFSGKKIKGKCWRTSALCSIFPGRRGEKKRATYVRFSSFLFLICFCSTLLQTRDQ